MQYSIVNNGDGTGAVTVITPDDVLVAHSDHANYKEIVERCLSGDEGTEFADLFDIARSIQTKFLNLDENGGRVVLRDGRIYFDEDLCEEHITDQILRLLNDGDDSGCSALVNFLIKQKANPNQDSVKELHRWLDNKGGFTITPNGNFIAYKGVDNDLRSVNSGTAFVDGVKHTGKIPYQPGTTITMPRSEVVYNPSLGCSISGLHVATKKFADAWGSKQIALVVSPTDVVSVPVTEHEKMRVCRFLVKEVIEARYEAPIVVPKPGENWDF